MTSITVSVRSLVVSVVVATALVVVYLIGAAQPDGRGSAVAATEDTADAVPGIVMTGTGQVTGVPDRLGFDVSVKVQAPDVSAAMARANGITRRVLAALEAEGVAGDDVQTTGLSINPRYDYSADDAVLVGYGVSQRMSVLARDLSRAGATMSAVVDAGENAVRISDVRLRVGDLEALRADARAAAMEEARAKAEQYAVAAGLELGAVTSVREVTAAGVGGAWSQELRDVYAADRLSSVPVRAGTEQVGVTVSVVWAFD